MEGNRILTPKDLMAMLQLGRNSVYELLQLDIIKSVKIGRNYRIEEKDVLEYLAKHKSK